MTSIVVRGMRLGVIAMALAVVLAGCSGDDPAGSRSTAVMRDGHGNGVVTGDLAGRREATVDVVSGATSVVVRAADLHDQLFRAWTPDESKVTPQATVDGDTVRISLRDKGGSGPAELHLDLNAGITWRLRLDGGAAEQSVDLSAGTLSSLDFGAGSARIDAVLPRPHGTLAVRMTGGASIFDLHLPDGVPARVLLAAGAGQTTVDGTTHNGIAGGTILSTPDWDGSVDRLDLNLVAGVSTLTLDRARP
jgi:hypothetical protein